MEEKVKAWLEQLKKVDLEEIGEEFDLDHVSDITPITPGDLLNLGDYDYYTPEEEFDYSLNYYSLLAEILEVTGGRNKKYKFKLFNLDKFPRIKDGVSTWTENEIIIETWRWLYDEGATEKDIWGEIEGRDFFSSFQSYMVGNSKELSDWMKNKDNIRKMAELGFKIHFGKKTGYIFGINDSKASYYREDEEWWTLDENNARVINAPVIPDEVALERHWIPLYKAVFGDN